MRIGIDFDNTIASYDTVFAEIAREDGYVSKDWRGSKGELRDYFRTLPDGERTWMGLQGQSYGKYMHRAQLMPGVANFFLRCLRREIPVIIVSHKTEYGHYDPEKIPLRSEALKWMDQLGFFDPRRFGLVKENVYFESTRKEKVNRIAALNCTHFIDDLEEVFLESEFPEETKKIQFGPADDVVNSHDFPVFQTWADISSFIFGGETVQDIRTWLRLIIGDGVNNVESISGRGNSRVYKITTTGGKTCALKYYPDQIVDARPRLSTEFQAFQLLHQYNIINVPKVIEKDEDLNLGLYEWLNGEPVTHLTKDDLRRAIDFIEKLHLLSREIGENNIQLASEACLSANELVSQIEKRLLRVKHESKCFQELSRFLNRTFESLWVDVKDGSTSLWPLESRDVSLPKEKQILSPSDFGFHNCLKSDDGILIFLDFDYFGWDDPVKLTADFCWHPAMNLNIELRERWKEAMLELFSSDPYFEDRLNAAMPLYGLRWALIVLNEFLPGYAERRKKAGQLDNYDPLKSQKIQLDKAKRICDKVRAIRSQAAFA